MGESMKKPQAGMIGLAVMGSNLARNIVRNGFPCAVYNRSYAVTESFMAATDDKGFVPARSLIEFVSSMESPRQIFVMIKAGPAVDLVLEELLPLLEKGDIVLDAGNAFYKDTERRELRCKEFGVYFLGVGVSGGEKGALEGPSIMPGGDKGAWKIVQPVLEKISAKADGACTSYMGSGGAGHFVKTIHNGIEYADMQLICEAYDLLRRSGADDPAKLAALFNEWNDGPLASYLIEITSKILKRKDEDGEFLINKILDRAAQKGTGKWTVEAALDLGLAAPTIAAALDARNFSSRKEERVVANKHLIAEKLSSDLGGEELSDAIREGLFAAKIMVYAQGMQLLSEASKNFTWDLNLSEVARIWRGGCIIRAELLKDVQQAYTRQQDLPNLLFDPEIREKMSGCIGQLRTVVATAIKAGVPVPAFSSAITYYDTLRAAVLPHNLLQAQRDFFGAHTYERIDKKGSFHTEWEED